MSGNLLLHSLTNKYYYDDIQYRKQSKDLYSMVSSNLDNSWNIKKSNIYYVCNHLGNQIPQQGWKIHISANLENAREILDISSQVLINQKVSFKFIVDMEMLKFTSQKIYPRGSSGKFITVYPENDTHFLQLLNLLYEKLKDYSGPYILSDKRYKDCKVLYYRYGGMKGISKIDKNGDLIPLILDGNNQWIVDERKPYFYLPNNINNIIQEERSTEQLKYIGNKYRIDYPLMFSNSGGVYRATRLEDGKNVIIKEARPHTCLVKEGIDSVYLRKKEFEILNYMQNYSITPKPIEFFQDWEHYFLVEEYIEGMNLHSYCSMNNPFYKANIDENHINTYIDNLLKIFLKIVEALDIFHRHNFIMVDMSPNNIMVTENLDIKFIDLEACLKKNCCPIYQMGTPGFYEKIDEENFFESDLYSLGAIFFSCLLRRNEMLSVKEDAIHVFMDEIFNDYNLPLDLKNIILDLIQEDYNKRPSLQEVKARLLCILLGEFNCSSISRKYNYNILNEKYKKNIVTCLDTIKNIADLNRRDRVFPNTPYVNNALNVTSGALGIIRMFKLLDDNKQIDKYSLYIDKELQDCEVYPPGLYVGLAGMAWSLLELGKIESAKMLLDKCDSTIINIKDFSIYYGLSGYGLTLLKFWLETEEIIYLNKAIEIGNILISNSKKGINLLYWENEDGIVNIGYKEGASGIALFFLYLYTATKEDIFLNYGTMALNHDLLYRTKDEEYEIYSFPKDTESLKPLYPYFMVGSSGIISVLVRYYAVTKELSYLDKLLEMLPSIYLKYSVSPTLFMGLAGLGNTLLDCYQFLGDEEYKVQAYNIAEGIDLYKTSFEGGTLYTDDKITKLSADFGNGSSGILLFLNRLVNNEGNFCFYLDELINEYN